MGLNSIETYIPWNLHEESPGFFRFSGMLDLRQFLEIAHDVGLYVLLRPGPYICSEWDMGGLPAYLLGDPAMQLRSLYPGYIRAVDKYFDQVAEQVLPYMGRPVVGVQLENEYGAYGGNKEYMKWIYAAWKRRLGGTMYFTSDNGGQATFERGSPIMGVLKTINLDWKVNEKMRLLTSIQPNAPRMVAEFWTGWFDHWGESHHVRHGTDVVKYVKEILYDWAGNVNLYMFFGGTNFGFMAGANMDDNGTYLADTTSYDYDAFLTEYGEIRKGKYEPMRELFRTFWIGMGDDNQLQRMDQKPPPAPYMSSYSGSVMLDESLNIYQVLDIVTDAHVYSEKPLTMEEAGGGYGFVLYRHNVTSSTHAPSRALQIGGIRDFAYVFADGVMVQTLDRNGEYEEDGDTLLTIVIPPLTKRIDVIVENRGRVNYGRYLHDRKGILGNITLDDVVLTGFESIPISFQQDHPLLPVPGADTIDRLRNRMSGRNEHPPLGRHISPPTFFRGEISLNPGSIQAFNGEYPGTYCRVFGRGVLWINGFNVGRFHTGVRGPQRSLYVPGALFREGRNEILVLHMSMHLTREPPSVQFFDKPEFVRAT